MNVTGKTGSVFITGSWFGLLSLPALTGYLFDNVSPYCYIYACFGSAIAVAVVTFLAMGLIFFYNRRHLDQNSFFSTTRRCECVCEKFSDNVLEPAVDTWKEKISDMQKDLLAIPCILQMKWKSKNKYRCNILICHHFPVQKIGVHKQNNHLCIYPGYTIYHHY